MAQTIAMRTFLLAGLLVLAAAAAPSSTVQAHQCASIAPNVFCDSSSCPSPGHDHASVVPPQRCVYSEGCPHFSPHAHTYGAAASVGLGFRLVEHGVTVADTTLADCDGDGVPGDFDGDYETGVGGAFFGYGPWADEATCNFGLTQHGANVIVSDVVFGSDIWFVMGANDRDGPVGCETDGIIAPGNDLDDCLTPLQHGFGTTCGAGGDGGYWVFLELFVVVGNPAIASNPPTAGTITA